MLLDRIDAHLAQVPHLLFIPGPDMSSRHCYPAYSKRSVYGWMDPIREKNERKYNETSVAYKTKVLSHLT